MKPAAASFALLLGLTACAGPGGTSPGGGLMYRVPESPSVVYVTGDTSNIEIDAGPMGSLRMRGTGTSTMAVTFAQGEAGVQVTASIQELNARLSNPMGGAQTATAADVEGDIVFSMDARGHTTVISLPTTKGAAGQLANPQGLVYEFFPLLPGGAVDPGDSWTDTLHYRIEVDEGDTESTSVMTYTLVGDTVVDGRTLVHISMTGTGDVTGSGVNEGMEVLQVFSGDVEGTILWDPARSLYVSGSFERDMDGTVEVPAAGMPPMPMTVSGRSHVRLQGG
ncbi:MAG: hypothetical protein ACWGSQ_13850 [Longimicrobiales bacterium]